MKCSRMLHFNWVFTVCKSTHKLRLKNYVYLNIWIYRIVGVDTLRPSQQFLSHIGMIDFLSSWVESVLSRGYSVLLNDTAQYEAEVVVSCSRTQYSATGES